MKHLLSTGLTPSILRYADPPVCAGPFPMDLLYQTAPSQHSFIKRAEEYEQSSWASTLEAKFHSEASIL